MTARALWSLCMLALVGCGPLGICPLGRPVGRSRLLTVPQTMPDAPLGAWPTARCEASCRPREHARVVGCAVTELRAEGRGPSEHVLICGYEFEAHCASNLPAGRDTTLRRCSFDAPDPFVRLALRERVSVVAFRRLARELTRHGAPRSLVRAALRAQHDEVRHARAMTGLARRRGAAVPRIRASRVDEPRSVAEIALENAVEGCVREAFGVLCALRMAAEAETAPLARTLRRIAADEARHAALAFRIHRWAEPRLSGAERASVARAVAEALDELGPAAWPVRRWLEAAPPG